MSNTVKIAIFYGALASLGCDGDSSQDGHDAGQPLIDAASPEPDAGGEQVTGAVARLVRRAALHVAETTASPTPAVPPGCAQGIAVNGAIDRSSPFVAYPQFGFAVAPFVITAKASVRTSVRSLANFGGSYPYGYGYPFGAQQVELADSFPALGQLILNSDNVVDDALNDGDATIELDLQAGHQYVVLHKALAINQSSLTPGTFTLHFCAEHVSVDGQLWVSADGSDLIPLEPWSEPISVTTPAGAMGKLAAELQPDGPTLPR